MALRFPEHPDVVFRDAPLTEVLCQIRFSPILALLDKAGFAGFQEALRAEYPELESDIQAEIGVAGDAAEMKIRPRVWRMRSADERWRVSLGIDFVALESYSYSHIGDFLGRLDEVIGVLDLTVHPGRSKRIGFRKVNSITHPSVDGAGDWPGLLKPQLVGLAPLPPFAGFLRADYSELHLADEGGGVLSIRHGVDPESSRAYRLDLDYWTEKPHEIAPREKMRVLLREFSDSMTGFFHWCLEPEMYQHLRPFPRSEASR